MEGKTTTRAAALAACTMILLLSAQLPRVAVAGAGNPTTPRFCSCYKRCYNLCLMSGRSGCKVACMAPCAGELAAAAPGADCLKLCQAVNNCPREREATATGTADDCAKVCKDRHYEKLLAGHA